MTKQMNLRDCITYPSTSRGQISRDETVYFSLDKYH